MSEPLLSVQELAVVGQTSPRQQTRIVDNFNLEIGRGEVVALIGESGAGKSTIGLSMLGYTRPGCRIVAGKVSLRGRDILSLSPRDRRLVRGRHVAYVAQSAAAAFNPAMRLMAQLIEAPLVHGLLDSISAMARATDLCRRMDLPDPDNIGRKFPHELSGGQLQRLMAVMALSCSPDVMVLDEPTTAMDVTTQFEVLAAFKHVIAQEGVACLYISHDLAVVAQMADRIAVLRHGKTIEEGNTTDIMERPGDPYTRELLNATQRKAHKSQQGLSPAASMLDIVAVSARYPHAARQRQKLVLQEIGFSIPAGHCIGVIGESGAGKSTIARVIAGLLPPVSGELRHNGTAIASSVRQRPKDLLRRIQIVFQMPDLSFNPRMTVGDAVGRPLEFYFGLKGARRRERIAELLRSVELDPALAERFPNQLSGGQKQRASLARALAAEPDVLVCDEVTSSLDTLVGAQVLALLKSLQEKSGKTCVFITHDISKVASMADSIMVMYQGRIVESGPAEAVLGSPAHPYTRMLLNSVPELRTNWLDEHLAKRAADASQDRDPADNPVCSFYPRCGSRIPGVCDLMPLPHVEVSPGRVAACHDARPAAKSVRPAMDFAGSYRPHGPS
jgi:peptide/nickel transport system ATP-binding protein